LTSERRVAGRVALWSRPVHLEVSLCLYRPPRRLNVFCGSPVRLPVRVHRAWVRGADSDSAQCQV